ncbi:hypothetical protein LTR78_004932 [Recurvomyces mirabilis]|uniref:Uncharacterized protein n=1 Tax=Recurvomyces mirabilis TaxID=574656 RepID=A0AAE1C230_9PEZI|nr:hypothetical protein LTR78_004932 [Recurvomyces mirabilis]KAK5158451.1 hypothetical protein LTS14_003470 [Recurvomyces mirabilis]
MTKTLSAGLAWAVPVNPATLIDHAHAYLKVASRLHTLRLCHRFGKGDGVHIARLPIEIEQMIETCITQAQVRKGSMSLWDCGLDFECFQSECSPKQHCSEATPLLESAEDGLEYCTVCAEESIWADTYARCEKRCNAQTVTKCDECKKQLTEDCTRGCRAEYEEAANMVCADTTLFFEDHLDHKSAWRARITQGPQGGFRQYDEIINKAFGLEVHFIDTTRDVQRTDAWPKHENHRWHEYDDLQTTLCYLTLPKKLIGTAVFEPCQMAWEMSEPTVSGGLVQMVDTTSLVITEKQRRRFQHTMQVLELKPHVHGSQEYNKPISPNTEMLKLSEKDKEGTGSEKSGWPRLLLLAHSD